MSLRHRSAVGTESLRPSEPETSPSESSVDLPEFLQSLVEGTGVGLRHDMQYPFEKPDWLDMDRVRRGQQFAMAHIFGLMNANGVGVLLISAYQTILQPLIYTGKSTTPFTAYLRYFDTVSYAKSWYEGDLWDKDTTAHKNMKKVRGMHDRISKKINSAPKEEVDKKIKLTGIPMWTTLHKEMLDDFAESCPPLTTPYRGEKHVYVNQADLAVVQFGFFGLVVMFPSMFGIHNVTDEVLGDFIHLWRAIGYLLGIEDRYNICDGDVATVRLRCRQLVDVWLKPFLRQANADWVHMGRCMMTGIGLYVPGVSYEVSMAYLCRVFDIAAPRLWAAMDLGQKLSYGFAVVLYGVLMRVTFMWTLFNWLLETSMMKAKNMTTEQLEELKGKVYGYEKNAPVY